MNGGFFLVELKGQDSSIKDLGFFMLKYKVKLIVGGGSLGTYYGFIRIFSLYMY